MADCADEPVMMMLFFGEVMLIDWYVSIVTKQGYKINQCLSICLSVSLLDIKAKSRASIQVCLLPAAFCSVSDNNFIDPEDCNHSIKITIDKSAKLPLANPSFPSWIQLIIIHRHISPEYRVHQCSSVRQPVSPQGRTSMDKFHRMGDPLSNCMYLPLL